jgi:hypothetical protein
MNARLVFRQEAVNDAGAAQPRMPEFDTWVLLGLTIGGVVRVEPSPSRFLPIYVCGRCRFVQSYAQVSGNAAFVVAFR